MEEKIGVYRNSDKRSRQLKQKVRAMEMSAKGTLFPYIWNLQELFCRFSRGRGERGVNSITKISVTRHFFNLRDP